MKIALTKKLSDAMGLKALAAANKDNPLFSWTANWITVWDNRKTEDMLVLVNTATRFCVAIYQVKKKDLKSIRDIIITSISNTLLAMHYNPDMVAEYMKLAGGFEFTQNKSRQAASWVTQAGLYSSNYIANRYNGIPKMYQDTIGAKINDLIVGYTDDKKTAFTPNEKMRNSLTELTGMPAYKYRAFELKVTLDLGIYKVVRRLIVPADIEFNELHRVLQSAFDWRNYHPYTFDIKGQGKHIKISSFVSHDAENNFDRSDVISCGHSLSEFMPECPHMVYIYDMGDNWQHEIELLREIDNYDKESPYLLEASGQTPPEDVGGVPGFLHFLEAINNPNHPEHRSMKDWAWHWQPELREWQKQPKII